MTNITNDKIENTFSYEEYNELNHRFGRIFLSMAVCIMLLVPTVICLALKETPDFIQVGQSMLALIIFLASGFVEVITYAPLLGTRGTYLAFTTGNLVNLKVPCAVNARDQIGVEHGSIEGELVSSVAIATSSIVTTLVLAAGVILLTPLTPVLESPVLSPAFEMAFTALFGALAYKYFMRDLKLVPLPLILCIALQVATGLGKSALIPLAAVVTVLFAWVLFKRSQAKHESQGSI